MKKLFSILLIIIFILSACSSSTTSSTMNVQLMEDNAHLVTIDGKTQVSDLIDEDREFLDVFLEKHYNDKETFNSYNEKEQAIVLEAVKIIERLKNEN
ncbi:hypothetical protein [Calidifontibacillus oryziterrae]|uniref:hypothetical protein n=1 Tax=Calidifontibacillus oryziterrae TaxID=1191699 RepID=UPI000308CC03|nr:hypothetical protein [Calidifontibacillus oryziterrae]